MDKFTQAYVECALWASTGDSGEPLDATYDAGDLAPEALKQMQEDCADFQTANATLLEGIDSEQAGHDFWLTRNRHGAGFWDRGLGAIGDKLTAMAHAYGECDLYIGDDNRVYLA